MLKLAIEDIGTQLCLYLTSDDKQEIVERFYSLWNHGATSGELHWVFEEPHFIAQKPQLEPLMSGKGKAQTGKGYQRAQSETGDGEYRAYIWTNRERLEKAILNATLFRLLNEAEESNCFKGCKGGAMPYAKAQAQEIIDSIEGVKNWWRYAAETEVYELGEICAESPDGPTVHTDWNTKSASGGVNAGWIRQTNHSPRNL